MAGRLQDVILRGTRAAQPAATAVAAGTIYCVTDESNILERSTGSAWQAYSPTAPGAAIARSFGLTIDGGGSVITTGVKGFIRMPNAGTITRATLLSTDAGSPTSGSIVIDIWKDTYANYPPTDADSITSAAPPTITTATKSEDATLTGWTTAFSANDIFGFNVDSVTSLIRVTLIISFTPS